MDRLTVMPRVLGAPGCYIQGRDVLDQLGEQAATLGQKPFVLVDPQIWPRLQERVARSLAAASLEAVTELFQGQCSRAEIARTSAMARAHGCDVVVALGGGKTLDTGKGIGLETGGRLLIAPTIASNDAPTSRLVVIYHDDETWSETWHLPRNPDLVLVDTQVIAQAPSRFLVAGMGDALPTKFEAEQCQAGAGNRNCLQGRQTRAAMVLAHTAYDLIRTHGLAAKRAVEKNLVTEALELVVEANVLLSGLGFESGGLSAAHALTAGFGALPELRGSLHGEQAAFGLLVQLVIENQDPNFIAELMEFYLQLGLPVSLADMGLPAPGDDHFRKIVVNSSYEGSPIFEMRQAVDERVLGDAIRSAHALGLDFKKRKSLSHNRSITR